MDYTINMDIEIVVAILSSSLLTSVANGFLNRRKNSVEIEDKINEMASRLIDDQRSEIDALNGHILQLQKESREAKERENHLESEIDELRICVDRYRERDNRRKEENAALKKEIDKLRKSVRGLS
jgi:outer membrane murein-binding lipoprotein Lpp